MFNLVGKRFIFLLISLAIIIPGTASLIFKGLDVGIDFAGGATVSLRPNHELSTPQITSIMQPLKLNDLQIVTGANNNLGDTIWLNLNTQVDTNLKNYIQTRLQTALHAKYPANQVKIDNLEQNNKGVAVVTVTGFGTTTAPTPSDIQNMLGTLPKTTDPNAKVTATPTPVVTPAATTTPATKATATPSAKATATPNAKATATPVATATPTPSTTQPQGTIPVNVVSAEKGNTSQIINLLTSSVVDLGKVTQIQNAFNNQGTQTNLLTNSTVSPAVAGETTQRSVIAVIVASIAILLYVWFSFRKVARPWRYGASAIIALLHDVLVVLGVFSILGWALHIQVDALFITALLTVVGFSVHDTIVVFDRIRENMQRRTTETFDEVVNASLVQTLARSLNTSLTVIFTLAALTLFGGSGSTRIFTLALLVGIISGTYSSIFNASMILVIWEKGELGISKFRNRNDRPPRVTEKRESREVARARG